MATTSAPPRGPILLEVGARRKLGTLGAVALLGGSTILANRVVPAWAYPLVNGATAFALLALAWWARLGRGALGLDRRHLRRGGLVGLLGLAGVGAAFGIALAVPALRQAFQDGRVGQIGVATLLWLALVRIPLGTVLLEEVAFRGVLPALFGADDQWRWRPVLASSALFGLWHILPSLALQRNAAVHAVFAGYSSAVVPSLAVIAAAGAGVVLYWWRHAGRGLFAPMLVHLATNSGGVLAAWWVLSQD